MMIYCAHKYGGKEENKIRCETIVKHLQSDDLENTYISPIHTFGFMYNTIPYDEGMELCFGLLSACDELLVLSELSEGVKREIKIAKKMKIPIKYFEYG